MDPTIGVTARQDGDAKPVNPTPGELPGLAWRKSRYSNPSGNCVELARLTDGRVAVRDSRHPGGATLVYTSRELAAFLHGAKHERLQP